MDDAQIIRSLRTQLRIERALIALVILFLVGGWGYGHLQSRQYAIEANGVQIACVATEKAAKDVLNEVKRSAAGDGARSAMFLEDVKIVRSKAPDGVMTHDQAVKSASPKLSVRLRKVAILVDGKPSVAVDSTEAAGAVLEAAKQKYGSRVKNLAEEPQFKQKVTVATMVIDPAIYRKSTNEALELALSGERNGGLYTVSRGDLASAIARRKGVSLDYLQALNPDKNLDKLQIGDKLRVTTGVNCDSPQLIVIVRDQDETTEIIPYQTQTVSSLQLRTGKQTELNPGRNGLRKVVRAITYENGVRTGFEVIDETVVRPPVPRRIAVGIK